MKTRTTKKINNHDMNECPTCQLIKAIEEKDYATTQLFLGCIDCGDATGHDTTPLIAAIKTNQLMLASELLIVFDVDVDEKDGNGFRAIDYAKDAYTAITLLDAGSKPSFKAGRLSPKEYEKIIKHYFEQTRLVRAMPSLQAV